MNVNRRSFLKSSSLAAAGAGAYGVALPPARGQSAFNAQVYANCNAAHALAASQSLHTAPSGNMWVGCANPMTYASNDWLQNNYDGVVAAAVYRITPSMVRSASINQAAILANMQAFNSQVTAADVSKSLTYLDALTPQQVQDVLITIQQTGLRNFISTSIDESVKFGRHLLGYNAIQKPSFILPPPPPGDSGGGIGGGGGPSGNPKPIQGDPPGGGGDTSQFWTCAEDGAAVLVVGTAFAVLAVMTAPVSGPVLVGAGWEAISFWGSTIAATWGVGHAVAGCPF